MASDRATRDRLLEALYDEADGSLRGSFSTTEVGASIGLSKADAFDCSVMLQDQGLIGNMSLDGSGMLLPEGIRYVERLREQPSATPAGLVVLNVVEMRRVEEALGELEREGVAESLTGNDRAEFEAEVGTVGIQLRSPAPKRGIIKAALRRIADLAIGTASGLVVAKLTGDL